MDIMSKTITTDIRFSIVPESVIDAAISDRAVRVYSILARYADSESGEAFPSRETIAKRARCHVRSVDRAIDELVENGFVEKHHRKDGESYQSNLYVVKRVATHLSLGGDTGVTRVATPVSLGGDTGVDLTRTTELEPREREPLNDMFAQFWAAYPMKKDKRAAERAFTNALKRADYDTILAGATAYRDDPNRDPGFTKYPATWLNKDSWENGPEPARARTRRDEAEQRALENARMMKQLRAERGLE